MPNYVVTSLDEMLWMDSEARQLASSADKSIFGGIIFAAKSWSSGEPEWSHYQCTAEYQEVDTSYFMSSRRKESLEKEGKKTRKIMK